MGTPQLFEVRPAITDWLPDETLYSACSRYHLVSAHHRPDMTCSELFGHTRQGSSHDFPARVDEFVHRMHGCLGYADEVVLRHTLLPFYLHLRTAMESDNAVAAVKACGLGPLKARLGILASRFGAAHPLKSCVDCMVADLERFHVDYWHRDHQWPGACICLSHRRPLQIGLGKVNSQGRFHWYLPSDLKSVVIVEPQDAGPRMSLMERLTECCVGLGNLPRNFHMDPAALRGTYFQRLVELDLARPTGSIRVEGCIQLLNRTLQPLCTLRGLSVLADRTATLGDDFVRLLRKPRAVAHPLRHMLVVAALFESWDAFLATYAEQSGQSECALEVQVMLHGEAPRATSTVQRDLVVNAIVLGNSARFAAGSAGVSVATAMAWAASSGLQSQRRPKKLKADLLPKAIALLRRGSSKESVASAVSVSIETVTRLLRTTPGLQETWHQVRKERQRHTYRVAWQRTAAQLARPTASEVRSMQPAAFAWLYRHDRAWLEEFAAQLSRCPRSNNASVRWDERDSELARGVQHSAARLAEASGASRVRLAQLCDAIPELKGRLSKLDLLPLTRSALRIAIGKR